MEKKGNKEKLDATRGHLHLQWFNHVELDVDGLVQQMSGKAEEGSCPHMRPPKVLLAPHTAPQAAGDPTDETLTAKL